MTDQCERCKRLENQVYDVLGALQVANLKLSVPRPWVGLTDDEFLEACQLAERGNYLVAFQRVQIKLKERNT